MMIISVVGESRPSQIKHVYKSLEVISVLNKQDIFYDLFF